MQRDLLITGATGTVSSALIDALESSDFRLRTLVHDDNRSEALRNRGIETFIGDLGDPRSLPAAFEGVHDLWLLTPNGPRACEHSMNAVWAARRSGVERVVRLSAVRAADDAPTRSERLHAMADHQLQRSGMAWTILRPLWFMQNLFNEAGDITAEGVLRLNLEQGRVGMVDARDVAALAASVLTDRSDRHHGQIYTVTGPQSISIDEVAKHFEAALHTTVRYVPTTDVAAEKRLHGFGVPSWIVGMLTEYAQAYKSGWGDFTTTDFHDVTGRHPRDITDFIRDHTDVFTRRR